MPQSLLDPAWCPEFKQWRRVVEDDPPRIFLAIVSIRFMHRLQNIHGGYCYCGIVCFHLCISVASLIKSLSNGSNATTLHHQQYHFHPYLPLLLRCSPDYQCFRCQSRATIIIPTSLNQYCNNIETIHACRLFEGQYFRKSSCVTKLFP